MNLRKEVGIVIKSKETSSQLETVRNSCIDTMHQPVTVSLNIYPYACINKALSSISNDLRDLIPTLPGRKYISDNTSRSRV